MRRLIAVAALVCLPLGAATADDDIKARAQQSKAMVQSFMGDLQAQLQAAMKEGGPTRAISVCNTVAPAIAKDKSRESGWTVGRTSLKLRNQGNAPDAWEEAVLKQFEERKAKGEDVKPMAHFAVVEQDGRKVFRFMKAIPTGEVCLKCHGENIAAPIAAKLDELYPGDAARGFKAGDIRGAFTISQPM